VRTLLSSVLFALLYTISHAQTVRPPLTAIPFFITAYSRNHTDAFSSLANPAALTAITALSGGVYGERRFLLQDLPFYHAVFCLPTTSGQFGFSGSYFGQSTYNESSLGLSYGRSLGDVVDIGARFNYHTSKMPAYGTASALYVEGGALLHLNQQVHVGLYVSNPTGAGIAKGHEDQLPVVVTVGAGYEVSPQFFVAGEVQQTVHRGLSVNTGMQYHFDERLWARVGFRSSASVYYAGLGVRLMDLRLEATASVHPQLGVTPGLLVLFTAKKKEQ
jgi:hypothetical protein